MNYTKQQIRSAILRAADRIQENPTLFNFANARTPDCGSPGCAIGWCAFELGVSANQPIHNTTPILVGWGDVWNGDDFCDREFYNRMDALAPGSWIYNADNCAKTLRAYADKYFPAERTDLVPIADFNRWLDGVRAGVRVEEPVS